LLIPAATAMARTIWPTRWRVSTCGVGPDKCLDLGLWDHHEDPLQDQEIEVFVAKGEGQVIGEGDLSG
jgi:hypothetical protein